MSNQDMVSENKFRRISPGILSNGKGVTVNFLEHRWITYQEGDGVLHVSVDYGGAPDHPKYYCSIPKVWRYDPPYKHRTVAPSEEAKIRRNIEQAFEADLDAEAQHFGERSNLVIQWDDK